MEEVAAGGGNRLHLHLTDDQGWHLPLPRGWNWRGPAPALTVDELRGLVAHGRALGVECMPEVDLPGHCGALLEGRPELACPGRGGPRPRAWGCHEALLCLGHPELGHLVESLLDHLAELFPFGVVHLGGDEVPAKAWRGCPRCEALAAREGLASVEELPGWWLRFLAPRLAQRGLRGAFWDEALEAGAPAGSLLFAWRGEVAVRRCLEAGFETVACPQRPCYLDHYPGLEPGQPMAIGGWNPRQRLRTMDPLPSGLENRRDVLLGAQANLWTEYVPDEELLKERLQPRLDALLQALVHGPGEFHQEVGESGLTDRLEEMAARGWRPRLDPPRVSGSSLALRGAPVRLHVLRALAGTRLEIREDGGRWRDLMEGGHEWTEPAAGFLRVELREVLPPSGLASRPLALTLAWEDPWPCAEGATRRMDTGVEGMGLVAAEPDWRQVSRDTSLEMVHLADWSWPEALLVERLAQPRPRAGKPDAEWRDGPPTPELPPLAPWGAVRGLSRKGWLEIPATGVWVFSVESHSLARLWLDGRLLVDHDGFAPAGIVEAWAPLAAGRHELRLDWLDLRGGACHLRGPRPAPGL